MHYEIPMEKKVPWNGAVSMRSRAGSWESLSICITLRHNQGAPAEMSEKFVNKASEHVHAARRTTN